MKITLATLLKMFLGRINQMFSFLLFFFLYSAFLFCFILLYILNNIFMLLSIQFNIRFYFFLKTKQKYRYSGGMLLLLLSVYKKNKVCVWVCTKNGACLSGGWVIVQLINRKTWEKLRNRNKVTNNFKRKSISLHQQKCIYNTERVCAFRHKKRST